MLFIYRRQNSLSVSGNNQSHKRISINLFWTAKKTFSSLLNSFHEHIKLLFAAVFTVYSCKCDGLDIFIRYYLSKHNVGKKLKIRVEIENNGNF